MLSYRPNRGTIFLIAKPVVFIQFVDVTQQDLLAGQVVRELDKTIHIPDQGSAVRGANMVLLSHLSGNHN